MGEVHALRIKSPYKLLHVEDIKIINRPNEHGRLYLKCLIDESINFKYSIEASTKDEITVYEEKESKSNDKEVDINKVNESKSAVLFNGLTKAIKTTNENGNYYVEIEGISKTSELDIKEKSRSFQNINMTYDELISSVLKNYSEKGFIQSVGCSQKINKPIFQYKETDWNFLKRICSELNSEIYCDIISINNLFYFGRSKGKTYEIKDNIQYKACKDLKAFYKAGGYDEGYHDTDYFYYEIDTRERYNLGDNIYFKQKDVYVTEYVACKYQDEIIYKYKLCRKNGVWQTKIYNSLISGASIEGKVLATQGEEVKLHLDIDKDQGESEAAWFKYAPPTGNTMYSMPIVGTSAKLYFSDETCNEPLVSGCVRNNGRSCEKTADTTKRYFGTEHGSEVEMTPSALNIKGGSKSPISISIDDNVGITITSPKKLNLSADSEIIMKTPKNVKINGVSQINAQKTNTESGFSLETDLHFLSEKVTKNGSSSESYADFDDEPQAGQMPEPEPPKKKKGFSWGSLLVAVVAVAAVAVSVATFGVGAVLVGAAVGAAISVLSTAVGDAISGEKSSLGTYIKNALVGAVSGAIFGPFGAFESLGGMMAFGGITGMADSLLNQAIEGEFSLGQTLFDGAIGAATAGLLHGAGKALKSASKYVKNAVNKVLSKNESVLMNIAKKLDDVFAPVKLAQAPDGMTVPVKEESTKIQDAISKIVDDAKGGGKNNFSKSKISKMNSSQDELSTILKNEKITLNEFNSMRMKSASELTDEQRKIMMKIREQVPAPNSDTTLQKVIDGGKIDNYIKDDDPWNTVGGFITKAQDTKELSKLQEVYDGLALGYENTPFNVGVDKDYGVIRFKTDSVDKIDIPYGPTMERVGAKAPAGGFDTSPDPFTGHGFTKDMNDNIIPEYTMQYLKPNEGAELYRVNSETGIEELIAKYVDGKFVKIK